MTWNSLHGIILAKALEEILGDGETGSMAFVRCLSPEVAALLGKDQGFTLSSWEIWRVADEDNRQSRTIMADRAVEMREEKRNATLLLVDTLRAGAGMDGIYSAAREVNEKSLFKRALGLAAKEITKQLSSKHRRYAEKAVKKAQGYGRLYSIGSWTEYDFFVRVAAGKEHPGSLLYLLGLWPVSQIDETEGIEELDLARMFVDRLLGSTVAGITPAARIQGLRLLHPSEEQLRDLEAFLWNASTKPILSALQDLVNKPHLWVNALRIEGAAQTIQGIDITSWRTKNDQIAKWSGLIAEFTAEDPPVFILKPDAEKTGEYSKLEVRWKARPENLEKGAVEYRVAIMSDMEEELTAKEISHSAKKEGKCRFTNDDFATLSDDALINAKIVVSVIGNDSIESQETEEFVIRFGQPPGTERSGLGKKVRTFSEGMIELESREIVSALASSTTQLAADSKNYLFLRTHQRGKSFRIFQPSLIREVEQQWIQHSGAIGRWQAKVRASGARAGIVELVKLDRPPSVSEDKWDRATNASSRMAERFVSCGGGVGQIYDENAKHYDSIVKEYILAWAALLEEGAPVLGLANTVEIQSLSGRTIGLIVLPSHPLRVCWHAAYDNLVLHAAFQQGVSPKEIREELAILDGAMFPAILPGLDSQSSFVFADTLGFHAVGMVTDSDKEPKAAIALLARALGESDAAETSPTVGKGSAQILGNEIYKYLKCHASSKLLHIHALRPGDGLTVARSLGAVQKKYDGVSEEDADEEGVQGAPSFVLELYPSEEQRGIAGRFIAEVREKRRSGAGVLSEEDYWMLESLSLPGGVTLPRLRWARKRLQDPKTPAHLAIAFDTFESKVICEDPEGISRGKSYYAYGLLSFFDRQYVTLPYPKWTSVIPLPADGEKHPTDRMHTDRLVRLQQGLMKCVAENLKRPGTCPVLKTEISPEKAENLNTLHRLCDWVITLDRNVGIEYFDSPLENRDIYDAYVIDCVPEREDLGCLQLVTSTSNLDEVRGLLDEALNQMGLSRSLRNAQFLLENLKSLSGRLAIRLTGQKAPTSELIALAVCHANCLHAQENDDCWLSLSDGFFIPVDDVRDLLPPIRTLDKDEDEKAVRPDLIYVSFLPRKGPLFRFIEVKYRRHLRSARNPADLNQIRNQTESVRKRWQEWYAHNAVCSSFRAIRRAKLARVLRFYADKAHRHCFPKDRYDTVISEIDRMIAKGAEYIFPEVNKVDRGWVFCPEYAGTRPLLISPESWNTSVFLFGPSLLPDLAFRDEVFHRPQTCQPELPPKKESKVDSDTISVKETEETDILFDESTYDKAVDESLGINQASAGSPGEMFPTVCFGKDILTEAEVRLELKVKGNPHLLVAGMPGMGKTTCLLNLCGQMLEAGIRPILFSYHQDIDKRIKSLVDSVRFIDFHGLGFNPLHVLDRQNRMAYLDVAGALRDIFVAIFPELGDIQGERIRRAIKESFIEIGWDISVNDLNQLREPEFKRFIEILRANPKPDRGLRTLLSRLEELEDYGFFELAEGQQSLWESDLPTVIRIHTTQNDNLQKAFASLVLYGLYKDMFRRGLKDTITHAVVFDEAHRAAGLGLIPTMAKECRKYGIALILASQEAKDFNVSLFSAIANYLVLRLTEADAKALIRNVASSQQERTLIDKIKQMDRFKALYFCEGKSRPAYIALSG
jgi:DNA phosphorothioation-dependent restriction protein DptH